jgi:L-amino acid N-acyltransferase YncA
MSIRNSTVGFKRGQWLDTVIMRRGLGRADTAAP